MLHRVAYSHPATLKSYKYYKAKKLNYTPYLEKVVRTTK